VKENDDRNCLRHLRGDTNLRTAACHDYVGPEFDQFLGEPSQLLWMPAGGFEFNAQILALDISELSKPGLQACDDRFVRSCAQRKDAYRR
jgi:hypothetical protein